MCGRTLVRNGKTAAGKQRYRCLDCGASRSGERPDVSRRAELEAFLGWLLGSGSQAGVVAFGTPRSFRRRTEWCWNIAPRFRPRARSTTRFRSTGSMSARGAV
ncbi:IS1/IS1595 family N-terminal zinc-binding domain-containing protein [Arthrobacter sp. YAF34]|uniref:IS1/IS1595 family N-terminal zinc-binding domain-containing protein n=1 Tax=Arthrobacter sp. YAF34 TaxID=3233083 RepID=UPI003F8FE711